MAGAAVLAGGVVYDGRAQARGAARRRRRRPRRRTAVDHRVAKTISWVGTLQAGSRCSFYKPSGLSATGFTDQTVRDRSPAAAAEIRPGDLHKPGSSAGRQRRARRDQRIGCRDRAGHHEAGPLRRQQVGHDPGRRPGVQRPGRAEGRRRDRPGRLHLLQRRTGPTTWHPEALSTDHYHFTCVAIAVRRQRHDGSLETRTRLKALPDGVTVKPGVKGAVVAFGPLITDGSKVSPSGAANEASSTTPAAGKIFRSAEGWASCRCQRHLRHL